MALQNRVTPFGEIIATPARGTFMGNRGCLHDSDRRLGRSRWKGKAWICCLIESDRRIRNGPYPVMTPGYYTELFFLDEAVALAAGHRPCYECRRADARAFAGGWPSDTPPTAPEIDRTLHEERIDKTAPQKKRRHERRFEDLPNGAFVEWKAEAWLVWGTAMFRYTPAEYVEKVQRPGGTVEVDVLTPPSVLSVLAGGYAGRLRRNLHESADIPGA